MFILPVDKNEVKENLTNTLDIGCRNGQYMSPLLQKIVGIKLIDTQYEINLIYKNSDFLLRFF